MSILKNFLSKPITKVIGGKKLPTLPKKNPPSLYSTTSGDTPLLLKKNTQPSVSVLDVAKEVPKEALNFLQKSGQTSFRVGAAGASAFTGEDFVPEGQFQKDLYGTDKPINLRKVGRELRLADPEKESEGVFKGIDPVLGVLSVGLDAFPTGGQMKKLLGLSRTAKETIAASKDITEISRVLKQEVPDLTDDVVSDFSKIFKEIDNVSDVDSALNRIKTKMTEKRITKEPSPTQSPMQFISKPVTEIVPSITPPVKSIKTLLSKPVQEVIEKPFQNTVDASATDESRSSFSDVQKYKTEEEFQSAVRAPIERILKLAGNDLEDVKIVGSVAEGKANPNDVDILITPKKNGSVFSRENTVESTDLYKRRDANKLLTKELQPFFPNTKIQVFTGVPEESRGKAISLSDFFNSQIKNSSFAPKRKPETIYRNEPLIPARMPQKDSAQAAEIYYDDVIRKAREKGEPTVIGGDDLKTHFGKDFDDANHPVYSKAAFSLYEKALKETPNKDVIFTGGGPGSGKTDFLINPLKKKGFDGVVYDSNFSNLEGAKRQIEMAKAAGKNPIIHGIIPNLDKAYGYTKARQEKGGHGISTKTFATGHSGFPAVAKALIEEGILLPQNVKLFDFRNVTTAEEAFKIIDLGISAENPLALLRKAQYNKEDLIKRYDQPQKDSKLRGNNELNGVQKKYGGGSVPLSSKDRSNTGRSGLQEETRGNLSGYREAKERLLAPYLEDSTLDDIATAIKNKNITENEISNLSLQLSFADEALDAMSASKIRRYVSKATGRLPEVTGKPTMKSLTGNGKEVPNSKFGRFGDSIVTQYGFKDPTEAQEGLEKYISHKERVSELKEELRESKKTKFLANKGEELMSIAMSQRRSRFKALKNRYDLTDSELANLRQKKDLSAMSDKEFQDFIVQSEMRASELEAKRQARIQVEGTIHSLQLRKVENIQRALKLPKLKDMSVEQLAEFDTLLNEYKFGDEFLGTRKIETIDRTPLKGVRTYREARESLAKNLSERFGREIKPEELDNLVKSTDRFKWDTVLAEQNPFYRLLVENVNENLLDGESRIIEIQEEVNRLLKPVNTGFKNKIIPTNEKIIHYLESPDKAKLSLQMSKAELKIAEYMRDYFDKGLEYLYKEKALNHSRFEDVYYPHMQRGFLEALKTTEGSKYEKVKQAFKALIEKQKLSKTIIDILDQKTGQILPMDKYFKYVQERKGDMIPSKNAGKVFLEYVKMLETKKSLDKVIPEIMTYVDVLTPRKFTRTGLEMNDKLKSFVTEYINNKKGRRVNFMGVEQGSTPDTVLKSLGAFISMRDLGVNLITQIGSMGGAQAGVFTLLGPLDYAKGLARYKAAFIPKKLAGEKSQKIKDILEQSKSFTGRNPWGELADISQDIGSKVYSSMFVLFKDAIVRANKIFLLGSLSKEEIESGKISAKRLAELKIKAGRWLPMEKSESIYGSTTAGKATTKYKTWAIAITYRALKNTKTALKLLAKGDVKGAYNNQDVRELVNATLITSAVAFLGSKVLDEIGEDKDSFVSKLKTKLQGDAMSFIAALNPQTLLSTPRLASFLFDLGTALKELALLEEYQKSGKGYKKGDLKGVEKLQNTLKPVIFNNVSDLIKSSKKSEVEAPLNTKKLPKLSNKKINLEGSGLKKKLPKLPKLKKLPPIN